MGNSEHLLYREYESVETLTRRERITEWRDLIAQCGCALILQYSKHRMPIAREGAGSFVATARSGTMHTTQIRMRSDIQRIDKFMQPVAVRACIEK